MDKQWVIDKVVFYCVAFFIWGSVASLMALTACQSKPRPATPAETVTATQVVKEPVSTSTRRATIIPTPTPKPTATPGVVIHEVESGEYLRLIAHRYYGDEMLWPVIWEATSLAYYTGDDPDLIRPGDFLVVPVR